MSTGFTVDGHADATQGKDLMTTMQTSSAPTSPPRPGAPRPPRPASSPGRSASPTPTIDPVRVLRQYIWWIALSVIIGAGVGFAGYLVWAWTSPIYSALSVWQINLPKREPNSVDTAAASTTGEQLDRTIATVAATMVNDQVILRPAIASPEVRQTTWIKKFTDSSENIQIDDALADLKDRIRAIPGNTFQIGLKITGPNKADLVAILTAVNREYNNWLTRDKETATQDVTQPFTSQRDALVSQMQALSAEIKTRIETNKISLDVRNSDQAQALGLIREAINQRQSELKMMQATLAATSERRAEPSLTFNDDERAAARQDPKIIRIENDILQMRTDIRAARLKYGDKSRYVQGLQDQLAAAEAERDTEIEAVMLRDFNAMEQTAQNNVDSINRILAQLEVDRAAAEARLNDLNSDVQWVNTKQSELDQKQEQLASLNEQIGQATMVGKMLRTQQASLIQQPYADPIPVQPKWYVMIPLGIFLVAGFTTGGIFLRELTDRRIKGPGCVGTLPSGHVIGAVPHLDEDPSRPKRVELIQVDAPRGVLAESIRHVFAPLSRKMVDNGHHSLLFVSGHPGAGCTAMISNIAACFAGSEKRVLVIDGNFRRPRIAEVFGVAASPGLGDVLNGAATLDQSVQDSRVEKVSVLTAGSESSRLPDLLTTPRLALVMSEARQKYDFILVDSPATVVSGDWQTLANHMDATVLVVRCMQDERGLAARLIAQLRDAKPEHLGVIVNAVRSAAGGYLKRNLRQMDLYQRAER